jgi:hypothetical protein
MNRKAASTWRFSRDPIGENGGVNLYAYAGNAPLSYLDPEGTDGRIAFPSPGGPPPEGIHDPLPAGGYRVVGAVRGGAPQTGYLVYAHRRNMRVEVYYPGNWQGILPNGQVYRSMQNGRPVEASQNPQQYPPVYVSAGDQETVQVPNMGVSFTNEMYREMQQQAQQQPQGQTQLSGQIQPRPTNSAASYNIQSLYQQHPQPQTQTDQENCFGQVKKR